MTKNEKIFDLLYNHGLAWTAEKLPLFAERDEKRFATNDYGVFKTQNGEVLGQLGTCKDRYEIFQNKEMAETIVEAANGLNLEVQKGGELQGGKKVFLQVALPQDSVGNSGIKRWLTAMNSHDGSSSIGFGTTNTVIVCTNTFHYAMKDVSKIRHTASYSQRVKDAIESIKMSIQGESLLMDNFKRMADTKVEDDKFVIDLVSKILDVNPNEKASTRKANQVRKMAEDISTDINIHGDNLWAVFNGITRYTNHSQVKSEKAIENVMVGQGAKMNDLAFKEIMRQVNASLNTSVLV